MFFKIYVIFKFEYVLINKNEKNTQNKIKKQNYNSNFEEK